MARRSRPIAHPVDRHSGRPAWLLPAAIFAGGMMIAAAIVGVWTLSWAFDFDGSRRRQEAVEERQRAERETIEAGLGAGAELEAVADQEQRRWEREQRRR